MLTPQILSIAGNSAGTLSPPIWQNFYASIKTLQGLSKQDASPLSVYQRFVELCGNKLQLKDLILEIKTNEVLCQDILSQDCFEYAIVRLAKFLRVNSPTDKILKLLVSTFLKLDSEIRSNLIKELNQRYPC